MDVGSGEGLGSSPEKEMINFIGKSAAIAVMHYWQIC